MISTPDSISLSEWQTLSPDNCPKLIDRFLEESRDCSRVTGALNQSRLLELVELKRGLRIKANSHVGRVRVGDLRITILPKINSTSLLRLLRYAYGFRKLQLISDSKHLVDDCGFEDLLIAQLNAEVRELISRGLHRSYVRRNERLASPRGRIDVNQIANDCGVLTASLPCQHHPRIEDTPMNQVLLAGLKLAGSMASLIDLRRDSHKLASMLEEQVSFLLLDNHVITQTERKMNRLTSAYDPAISIIRLLLESQGIVFEGEKTTSKLPGFLFDMNMFFQALLSRFLKENLEGVDFRDEHGLKGMMRYSRGFNPLNRRSPTPRPDFAVLKNGKLLAILDAKYRDLWETKLPRNMLYQLVVYAVSQVSNPKSTIIYPTLNPAATEQRIVIHDPINGREIGQVALRPVNLQRLEKLVTGSCDRIRRERAAFAYQLVFGRQ